MVAVRMTEEEVTEQLVTEFLDAFEARDFERVAGCLSDREFRYEGPMDQFDDALAFTRDLEKYGQILRGIERRRLFVNGSEACVVLTFVTTMSEIERTRMVVWVTVANGKIVRAEGFLDPRAYVRMFDS